MYNLMSLTLRTRNHPSLRESFQRDAVATGPDLGGRNVPRAFEMALRHNRRTARTELERVFCRWIHGRLTFQNIFLALLRGG